ncbi:hypothetical protein ACE6H2_026569 [Prunus campanulata]
MNEIFFSLTVVDVFDKEDSFNFMLVAYTQQNVVIPLKKVGQKVNLEVDILSNSGKKKQHATKSAAEAEISRLDIRVGLITKAQNHPNADSLEQLCVDL